MIHWQNQDGTNISLQNMIKEAIRQTSPEKFQATILFHPNCSEDLISLVKNTFSKVLKPDAKYYYSREDIIYNEVSAKEKELAFDKINIVRHLISFVTSENKLPESVESDMITTLTEKENTSTNTPTNTSTPSPKR